MAHRRTTTALAVVVALVVGATGCAASGPAGSAGGPHIVVTTSILGDVVEHLVGGAADVQVIMPPGAGPHDFQASAKQAVAMHDADVLVINGLGFEGGLLKAVSAAKDAGVDVFDASSAITPLRFADEGGQAGGGDADEGALDPHFFTDPGRMVLAAKAIATHLQAQVPALRTAAFRRHAAAYVAELTKAEAEVRSILAPIPAARRTLVTNHDVFAYFAQRYDFRIVGAVIPSLSTQAEPSARSLDRLVATIKAQRVPAIFADTSAPATLADKLARTEGLRVEVVQLYSEALGPKGSSGATYIDLVTTNARRIAAALT